MKRAFVALFALSTFGIPSLIASEYRDIDPKILSAFQKEFSFAKNVKWEVKGELAQVNFLLYDQGIVAWYNSNAELITTARNILYMQLPISVIKSLERDYPDAGLYGIAEFTHRNETFYHIQAEKKNKKYLLKASPSGSVTVIKRIK
ncbi:MAG TPA: hypothetical protein VJ765_11910 [Chitinophagaceae bacterium]|nr:hypothetical protein [Chitinophagaceae bacterium]